MSSINYRQLQTEVSQTIKDLGFKCLIRHQTNQSSSAFGIFSNLTADDADSQAAAMVTQTMRVMYVTNTKIPIEVGDLIVVNSIEYAVNQVTKYEPTSTNIAYRLLVVN